MSQLRKPFFCHQSTKTPNFHQKFLFGNLNFVGFGATSTCSFRQAQRIAVHRLAFLWLFFTFFLSSCEKAFDWQYKNENTKILALESIITNENKIQTVCLSWVRANPNDPDIPITNATVDVRMAGITYPFKQDSLNPGNYISKQAFIGVVDIPIDVDVVVDGVTYFGTDMMIPVTLTPKVKFKRVSATDPLYELTAVANTLSSTEQAMWEISIDWSSLPAYQGVPADSCKARLYYYDLKTIDVSEVFAPAKQTLEFPKGATVTQTKYSLSPEHAEFRRSMLLETEWRGGLFDVSPGTVYTNIKGGTAGAVGFFGASSVIKETFLLE